TLNGKDISGRIDVPNTGGWQNWETVTVENIALNEGEQKLRLQFDSGDFNINWMEFTSESVGGRPEIAITSPASNSTFENGETIRISAETSGEIDLVEFFADSELIGKSSKAPFTIDWKPKTNGIHTITARATTADGITGTSKPVNIDVVPGRGPLAGEPATIPGTIFAVDYDLGGPGKAYHDNTPGNNGGAYRDDDVDIEVSEDPKAEYNLGWFEAGEWVHYTVDVKRSGRYNLHLRLASAESDGKFHLLIDGKNITGQLTAPNTGGWQNWVTVSITDIELSAGVQTMRLNLDGGEFNLSRFDFELAESSGAFDEWIEGHLSPDDRNNPENSDPLADPHGDGISNLLKYALGMTPGKINRKKLPQVGQTSVGGESYLTLTYSHPATISDIEYIVEVSSNLTDWSAADPANFEMSSEESGGLRTVTVRDSRPISGEKSRFLRLRVEAK
ncbi:MAG TPA: carbohydrate-binding protein, partial [Opitutales bacterium]|nr:carbohydrate-binding protein [Opitutales bacterium]